MAGDKKSTRPGAAGHVHPEGETMEPGALRAHLKNQHGWTEAMLSKGRADTELNGDAAVDYMRRWHRNDHVPMAGS